MSKPNVMPAAKLLADEHGIDASLVVGTGPNCTVTTFDVMATIAEKNAILLRQNDMLAQQGLAPYVPGQYTARDQRAATPARAPSPATSADEISDQEANDMLWRLGLRAGLERPKAKYTYLANEDGTMYRSKKNP